MPLPIEEKLKKLKVAMAVMEGSLSREEFLAGFENLVEFLKKAQENLIKMIEEKTADTEDRFKELDEMYRTTLKRIEDEGASNLSNLKRWVLEQVGSYLIKSQLNEKLQLIDAKLAQMNAYRLPDASSVALEASKMAQDGLLPLIPIVEKVEEKLPEILPTLGKEFRNALELLQGDERLDVSAIKGLEELIAKVERLAQAKPSTVTYVGPGNSGGGRIVKSYDLSSQLNGVTKVFSVPVMWRVISIISSSFPNALRQTVDWVYDAGAHTITFTSEVEASTTLAAGQTVTVIYSE